MSLDFEKEITEIAGLIQVPGYRLSPETIPLAAGALEDVNRKYGPNSDNSMDFHNAPHSVGVTSRNVSLGNILYPYLPEPYEDRYFDLAILGGSTHDVEQGADDIANVRTSADDTVRRVEAADGPLNTSFFKTRLKIGVLATTVIRLPSGELVQVNLRTGSRDPFKFNMGFADINGIAMEGPERMFEDATTLYHERTANPTGEGQYDFYLTQVKFLRQRLNNWRIKGDLAFYFGDRFKAVFDDMYEAFHPNIVAAHAMAKALGVRPDLKKSIGDTMANFDSPDKSQLGAEIGEMIIAELAA